MRPDEGGRSSSRPWRIVPHLGRASLTVRGRYRSRHRSAPRRLRGRAGRQLGEHGGVRHRLDDVARARTPSPRRCVRAELAACRASRNAATSASTSRSTLAQLLEPPDARHLLDEHLVEPRVDRVRVEHRLDHRAHGDVERRRRHLGELRPARATSSARCAARPARRRAPPCSGSTGRATRRSRPPPARCGWCSPGRSPVVQRTRAVASRMASTVACERSCAAFSGVPCAVAGHAALLRMRVVDVSDRSHIHLQTRRQRDMQARSRTRLALRARPLWSFVDLVRHPEHLDRVFEISDAHGPSSAPRCSSTCATHFAARPARRRGPRARSRACASTSRELAQLPEGTLGRVFADHMRANGLDPATIPTLAGGRRRSSSCARTSTRRTTSGTR